MTDEQNEIAPVEVNEAKARKAADAKRKREQRHAKKLAAIANESFETKKQAQEDRWRRNIAALSPEQRDELSRKISDYNCICWDICYDGSRRMSSGEPYGSNDGVIDLRPEQWLAEVEAFVVEHPLQEIDKHDLELWKFYDYERAPTDQMGEHFKQFGPDFAIDFIDTVAYTSFLSRFRDWYRANRLTVDLEQGTPWSRSWEQVEELMAKNPRLGKITPTPLATVATATVAVARRPLTEAESIEKTLADLNGNIGASQI